MEDKEIKEKIGEIKKKKMKEEKKYLIGMKG